MSNRKKIKNTGCAKALQLENWKENQYGWQVGDEKNGPRPGLKASSVGARVHPWVGLTRGQTLLDGHFLMR